MFRSVRCKFLVQNSNYKLLKRTFLANEYKCVSAWNSQFNSPILSKINLSDFYTTLNQNYVSKGIISAIDVDIFANALKDPLYLEELKDLLHKLRSSAETGNTLESTHHATVRNYMQFGNIQELVEILKDPLSYGIFLDPYAANILLDELIKSNDYELAANVAAHVMLQEEYTNDITCTLCQYACYRFITEYKPTTDETGSEADQSKKVEEVKIRVKFLRNPYFDDHFDIQDIKLLAGKTLAWISRQYDDNVSNNLQILGWLYYKKFDRLLNFVENLKTNKTFKVYREILNLLSLETSEDAKDKIEKCISLLNNFQVLEDNMNEPIKVLVENAINRCQTKDIAAQEQLYKNWVLTREQRLQEQVKRLDRIKRVKTIEEKQQELQKEEQKLWFFENEEKIDLQIEEKEAMEDKSQTTSKKQDKSDEDYIPPEILPKKK